MNDEPRFIATPRTTVRPVRIDVILEKRMKDFLLARRQRMWHMEGQ